MSRTDPSTGPIDFCEFVSDLISYGIGGARNERALKCRTGQAAPDLRADALPRARHPVGPRSRGATMLHERRLLVDRAGGDARVDLSARCARLKL